MSGWLNWVSRRGDKELFMLSLLAIIIMSAGLTALFDLSYALGAFLAGMIISDTWHRHRVERIVDPFRRYFWAFLCLVGAFNQSGGIVGKWSLVLLAAGFLVFLRYRLSPPGVRLVGSYSGTVWRTAILLGGTGEFGFLLLTVARDGGVLEDDIFQWLLAAICWPCCPLLCCGLIKKSWSIFWCPPPPFSMPNKRTLTLLWPMIWGNILLFVVLAARDKR